MTQFSLKLLFSLLLLSISNLVNAATLSSSVDRNPIKINQTLTLTVQFDEQVDSSSLDLSELEQDFEILANSPNTRNSVSIINGQTTRLSTTTWRITLAAKRDGALTIPAFTINGVSSRPINLQVASLSAAELAEAQPVEVTLTIDDTDNLSIKPGEQIIVNIELSAATNVGNLRGEELIIPGVDIEPLGQQNGQRQENGVTRQVAIWRYALFPTNSGQIEIPSQTFTGTIGGRSSFFDSFISGGQQVGGRSVAQTINVVAQPNSNGNVWFPANDVSIESAWSGGTNQIRVGEPITRSITITASGQRANAIPPLSTNSQTDYKTYQDQPLLENTTSAQGLIGVRIETVAIVPSTSGELTLAEQRVRWWDNLTDQWREAVLPEETLTVLPGIGGTTINEQAPTQNLSVNSTPNSAQLSQTTSNTTSIRSTNWWWQLATICLALICLLQFYYLRKKTTVAVKQEPTKNDSGLNENTAWKQLQQSLKDGDSKTIRKHLLAWARSAMPNKRILNLDSISGLSNSPTLRSELNQLDKSIYSNGEAINIERLSTQIAELRDEFKTANKQQTTAAGELAPLYPA